MDNDAEGEGLKENCRRIRDDKGFWEQVEAYVSRHTAARFSHGICPDCMKRLLPEG